MRKCNSVASRIARVVVHPDYRADGIGVCHQNCYRVDSREKSPEDEVKKHLVETIAQMVRYNPFFEKAGFYYMWDTASGRPVLYYPLTKEAEHHIKTFS